jgi:MFS family permease
MADASKWTGVSRALERRNYRLFVAGQLVSLVGTWTQSVAQTWLVYRLTGSAFWLGVATFCGQAPVFFLATFGGLIADRHRRRTILVATQSSAMVLAFSLAALTLSGHVRVAHVLVLATLLGCVNAVDSPTRQSFVIDMVGRENLASAIALNSSMLTAATVLGPAIAGMAIAALGEGWCFVANGVSFVAVIAGLAAMRDLPAPSAGRAREPMFARVLAGFRFAATEHRVRALLVLLALTALMGIPSATVMPIFASKILHGDARTLGWLMGAQGGGTLFAALVLASRRSTEAAYRWIAGACGALGIALVLFALSRVLWVSLAISVLLGAATMLQVSGTNVALQSLTPDALRGRVMAIFLMIFSFFAPVGAVIDGSLATVFGPRLPLVVGGVGCMLGAIGFGRWALRQRPTTHPESDARTASVSDGEREGNAVRESREVQPGGALETPH